MGAKSSKENPTEPVSNGTRQKQRIAQSFLLVWVDSSIDESEEDCQNTLKQLRTIVNDVYKFTQPKDCTQFLNDMKDENVFVIVSGSLGQQIVPDIHSLPQVDTIYVFCVNQSRHEQWAKEWIKIKGVHTNIDLICESLQLSVRQWNEDSVAISFVTESEKVLNQLQPSFMYTQIFKEILLEMEHDERVVKQLADYSRKFYEGNTSQLNIIDEFEQTYQSKSAIWWYTRECFTYDMLNRALRTLEADTIIYMGFFIRDLHQEIERLHRNKVAKYHGKPFTVYRGQGLLKGDFEKLQKTKSGLISFNNFLSTSKKRDVSLNFAKTALTKTNMVGILFQMSIDPSVSSAPFASIQKVSHINTEKEILFSTHTVFRIGTIKPIDKNSALYEVDLTLTADDDPQLRVLSERIRQEVTGETGWKRLGQLLIKLSHFDKAEEFYEILLEQANDECKRASYNDKLGYIKDKQGDYQKAIDYYEKAREIKGKILPLNYSSLASSCNNIASASINMGDYDKASSFCNKALEIQRKSLFTDHQDFAVTYNNLGLVYYERENYPRALSFYEEALAIKEKTLPSNHPSIGTSYNNIAGIYYKMKDYFKALYYYEKDLDICQSALPPNHPETAASYNNIGMVCKAMGDYSKALSFYEKAFDIYQKTPSFNRSLLATAYNNIGLVLINMGEYSRALSHLKSALKTFQNSLSADHPNIQNVQVHIEALKLEITKRDNVK